jgi:hypothetical protein
LQNRVGDSAAGAIPSDGDDRRGAIVQSAESQVGFFAGFRRFVDIACPDFAKRREDIWQNALNPAASCGRIHDQKYATHTELRKTPDIGIGRLNEYSVHTQQP